MKSYFNFSPDEKDRTMAAALDSLTMAVKLDPTNAEAHYWLGEAISKGGWRLGDELGREDFDKTEIDIASVTGAANHFKKALELDPEYSGSYNILPPKEKLTTEWGCAALFYMVKGNIEKAKWAFGEAEKIGGFDEQVLEMSRNLLISCPPNAILLTNGDMDTFGLLFLQLMRNTRPDVKVLNLSLMNTRNFIKYAKQIGAPISFSDEEIDELRAYRILEGDIFRPQDIVLKNIVDNARGDSEDYIPPICFSITVSPENKLEYAKYNMLRGMVYELTTEEQEQGAVNVPETKELVFKQMKFVTVPERTGLPLNKMMDKLNMNYISVFIYLADAQMTIGDTVGASNTMSFATSVMPWDFRLALFSADIAVKTGDTTGVKRIFEDLLKNDPGNVMTISRFAEMTAENSYDDLSRWILESGLKKNPDNAELKERLNR